MFVTKKKYEELKNLYNELAEEYNHLKENEAGRIKSKLLNNEKLSKTSKKEIERCL